jgi:membrane protein YqaA with SNARE-associated domain
MFIDWARRLILSFGYVAVFFVSIVGTSTLFVPFPVDAVVSFAVPGLGLHPLVVGLAAGLGSTVGELTGYVVGMGSREVLIKERKVPWILTLRRKRRWWGWVKFISRLFERYGFTVAVIAAAIPFPFDVIGILAGFGRYDVKKFLLATAVGKCAKTLLIAYLGWAVLAVL